MPGIAAVLVNEIHQFTVSARERRLLPHIVILIDLSIFYLRTVCADRDPHAARLRRCGMAA